MASGISGQPGPHGKIGPKGEPGECVGPWATSAFFASVPRTREGCLCLAVVKQSTMIALWGDGRLGEVGRIRRGAWAPSLLVCGPWKYSDLRANAVFLGQEIQCPCCGTRRQPSQEPGTWHRVVLGCRSAARHGPAFRTASLQGPDRVERAPGVPPLACSITCRVRVGDHPPPRPRQLPSAHLPFRRPGAARSCRAGVPR